MNCKSRKNIKLKYLKTILNNLWLLLIVLKFKTSVLANNTTPPATTSPTTGGGGVNLPADVTIKKPANLPSQFSDLGTAFNFIFDLIIGISGTVFIIMLLVGGIKYLTSMGSDEEEAKAKKTLINAGIGITIVAVSWAIGSWVLNVLRIGK